MADSNQLTGFHLPCAKEIDEDRLVNQTWRAVICSGLAVLLVACVAHEVGSQRYTSLLSSICGGFIVAACPAITVSFTLFLGWGVSVAVLRRLNVILGRPLNPSAIAALGAGFGTALVHSATVAQLTVTPTWGAPTESLTVLICASAFLGSGLVQVAARVSVGREIARHNLRAGHIPFQEPPCDLKFQISQLMILTAAIALFLAIAMQFVGGTLILLVALWCVLIASTFFPAIAVATWVEAKMGQVKLKPWEEVTTAHEQAEFVAIAAAQAQRSDKPNATPLTPAHTHPPHAPLPRQRDEARYQSGDALSTASVWVALAGAFFCVLFVISHQTSQAMQGSGPRFDGWIFTIPFVFFALAIGLLLAGIAMAILRVLNAITGHKIQTGTIAAFAGGGVGGTGAILILGIYEIVHDLPWNGAIDCFSENNRFPLAMILLASLMGQTFARLGVKSYGHKRGLSNEECRAESSGPPWGRYCVTAWIFALSAWLLLIANNAPSEITPATANDGALSFLLTTLASIATVWPIANFVTRLVNLQRRTLHVPLFRHAQAPAG